MTRISKPKCTIYLRVSPELYERFLRCSNGETQTVMGEQAIRQWVERRERRKAKT